MLPLEPLETEENYITKKLNPHYGIDATPNLFDFWQDFNLSHIGG